MANFSTAEPNPELIRRAGYSVVAVCGRYCVAARGAEQIVLEWRDGTWERVAGKGSWQAAA